MSFNIGLSGLRAATSDLNITGNNIANAGTVGFKQSRAEFADLYAASVQGTGKNSQGAGVQLANVSQSFNQGNINYTQNALDLAINGNGFFQTSNNGEVSYTRAGYFGTDREGYMVNNFGYRLQGYAVDGNGNLQNGVIDDLRIQSASQAPRATSELKQTFNLNSTNTVPTTAPFDPSDPTTYNSSTSTNVYDTQGNAHVLTQYFVKQLQIPGSPTGGNWQMNVLIDGRNPADPASTVPYSMAMSFTPSGQLDPASLIPGDYDGAGPSVEDFTVDPASGRFALNGWVPATADKSVPPVWSANGATANVAGIQLDLRNSTQYASSFAVNSVSQDGYTTGQLAGLEIDDTGVIFARYTNGQSNVQGQIILASFADPQGLTPVGKSAWAQSFQSGEPVIGTPRSGVLGALQSGALEDSNVEVSEQLVNMIVAQRNYQASAKAIETESTITQTIINLR
ncbi:flagellar hook protein FlgE [Pseudomonas sp. sp1636]|uniref:flagellar hook protein FlgE n=1 Tax=Pseudomonas sp. sp1636 TaxID=3036707 RepID=UPI0025A5FDDE|nr:flagellar hook protein FlgE [Pseudomonas sp. sp1636]MDM8347709.1 flagellar hook protein FlgE [Pseudomonas sp. sp1636]